MADEINEGAPAPAENDLRSEIIANIERQRNPAPEPVAKEAAEPAETPEKPESTDGRVRDEHGRFKPVEKAADKPAETVAAEPATKEATKAEEAPAAAETPAAVRPPPGWSPKSKSVFDSLPAEVKADVAKREAEVNQGFAELAEYKPIKRFMDMAKQGGTTLETALTAYTNIENTFRRDPIEGIVAVCTNLKMSPQAVLAEMNRRFGGQAPSAQPQGQAQPVLNLPPELIQEITGLKSTVTALQREREMQEMNATTSNVEAFFDDPKNKYADNVSDVMADLIKQEKAKGGKINLPVIYEQACWLHPEVRDLLINERLATSATPAVSNPAKAQVAADQARQAAKAVTGAPSRGSPPSSAPPANESTRDTIRRVMAEQRGGL